ncbi:MAG: hypothetical protein NT051_00205 [Candidatus Micrarchaeota archaeon]|nr:hypothetical protein [Candidatus Micrarchaeota archaeon]
MKIGKAKLVGAKSGARKMGVVKKFNTAKKTPQSASSLKRQFEKKTASPETVVKKSTYSKTLRAAVLASAEARQKLIELGGENTINIIRDFDTDMSDEELARRTNIRASDVRVVLNRLHSEGLFSYTRIRDKDSGWYSYIWKMSEDQLKRFTTDETVVEVGEIASESDGEKYRCLRCSPEKVVGFETAVDSEFKCGSCGAGLDFLERKRK